MRVTIEQISEISKQTLLYIKDNDLPKRIHLMSNDPNKNTEIELVFEQEDYEDAYKIDPSGYSSYKRTQFGD